MIRFDNFCASVDQDEPIEAPAASDSFSQLSFVFAFTHKRCVLYGNRRENFSTIPRLELAPAYFQDTQSCTMGINAS